LVRISRNLLTKTQAGFEAMHAALARELAESPLPRLVP
jgi:hypothetical protein